MPLRPAATRQAVVFRGPTLYTSAAARFRFRLFRTLFQNGN